MSRQPCWHQDFQPIPCTSLADFDVMLGHEIASAIKRSALEGRKLALILPAWTHGHFSLGGLLLQRVKRRLRPCLWVQHGRVE